MPCLCFFTKLCPYHLAQRYHDLRQERGGKLLFINTLAKPVSAKAPRDIFDKAWHLVKGKKQKQPRPHSAKVTGARGWYRNGVSMPSICELSDWSDEKTLQHYLGSEVILEKLREELDPKGKQVASSKTMSKAVVATIDAMEKRTTF